MGGTPSTHLVTDDDHGAWLSSVAGILVAWTILTLGMRVFIRLRFNGPWMRDDTICTIGSALAVCQTGVVIAAVGNGDGKKLFLLDADQISYVQKALYASDILYIASLACSKISTSFLISRLTRQRSHSLFSLAINVLSLLWGIAGIFAIALRCDLSHPWMFNASTGFCVSQYPRWIGLETTSMFLEALIFGLSVSLVWSLQMAFRLKAIVVFAFSSRILILVPASVRLLYLSPSQNPRILSPNSPTPNVPIYEPFFTGIYAALLTQAVLHYALIAATIPCTKPFMKAFAGSLAVTSEGASTHGTGGRSGYGGGYGGGYGLGSSVHSSSAKHRSLHARGGSGSRPILGSAGSAAVANGRPGTARALSAGSDVSRTHTAVAPHGDDLRRLDPGAGEVTSVAEHAEGGTASHYYPHQRVVLGTLPGVGKKDGLPNGSEDGSTEWTEHMVIRRTRDVDVDYERAT